MRSSWWCSSGRRSHSRYSRSTGCTTTPTPRASRWARPSRSAASASCVPSSSSRTSTDGSLHPQDLLERGAADLELLLARLAGPDGALDLVPRPAQQLGDARVRVALAPGEHLDGQGDAAERDGA